MFLFQLSGLIKSENVRYFCELMYTITNIPVCFLNKDGDVTFEYKKKQILNPLYTDKKELLHQLQQCKEADDIPYFISTQYMETFFIINLKSGNEFVGLLIVGPTITAEMDAEVVNALLKESEIHLSKKAELLSYYQSLPVADYKKLIGASILLYYLIYGIKLDSAVIVERNSLMEKINKKIENTLNTELAKKRQYSIFHHTPAYEKYILQYVKEGNTEKLLAHLNNPADGESGILSKNPLRSQKNLFICSTALIARAAIEGGLSSELSLTISDSYIQQVEELNEICEVNSLYYKMCCEYTERVRRISEHHYSETIINCQNYIFKHIYEIITLPQLAKFSTMSCNYLSELFKKETGISISEYIQKEKVSEAKKLLLSGNSIMDVCIHLNFNDQSYFTKIFKKFTGQTPKQYRNSHHIC